MTSKDHILVDKYHLLDKLSLLALNKGKINAAKSLDNEKAAIKERLLTHNIRI